MHVLIISPLREGYMNLCGWKRAGYDSDANKI